MEQRSCPGLRPAGSIIRETHAELVISKQRLRRAEAIACVRLKRQEASQNLGFASRPFVLCGLPVKRPAAGQLCTNGETGSFFFRSPVILRRYAQLFLCQLQPQYFGNSVGQTLRHPLEAKIVGMRAVN